MAANNSSEINAQDISLTITVGTDSSNYGNTTNTNSTQTPGVTTGNTAENNPAGPTVTVTPGTTNTNTNTNKANTNTNTNANTNKANTNTNKATNTNSLSSYVNGYNQNAAGEDIPYTGVEDTIMYLMIAVMLVAIVSYVKFERVNKEIR